MVPACAGAFQATCSGVAACAAYDYQDDGYGLCRLYGEGMSMSTPGLDGWGCIAGVVKSGDYTVACVDEGYWVWSAKIRKYSDVTCQVKKVPGEGSAAGGAHTGARGGGWCPPPPWCPPAAPRCCR